MKHSHRSVPCASARALVLSLPFFAAGCGGSGSGGGSTDASAPANHAESLGGRGVHTSYTPRVDEHGDALPEDYAPLGDVVRLDPITELWFGGVRIGGGSGPVARLVEDVGALTPGTQQLVVPTVLHQMTQADAPWMTDAGADGEYAQSLRDAVAIDVDADGAEELVVVHFEQQRLHATIVRREGTAYSDESEAFLFNLPAVVDLEVAAGDLDGDRIPELVVGYTTAAEGWLRVFAYEDGRFAPVPNTGEIFHPQFANGQVELVLACGRLDNDLAKELVVVVNERTPSAATTTRYHVYDDLGTGMAEIRSGLVAAFNPSQGVVVATRTNVAVGDVDGDHLDEIVFGGLESLPENCTGDHYVAIVLDDAAADFETIGSRAFLGSYSGCDQVDEYQLVFPQVNTLDLDGDGLAEIQLDRFVFDDFVNAGTPLEQKVAWEMPHNVFLDEDLQSWFDPSTIATTTGDFDADGRDEVIVWRPEADNIHVYGLDEGDTSIARSARIAVSSVNEDFANPLLVAVDTDKDAPVLVSVPVGEETDAGTLAVGPTPDDAGGSGNGVRRARFLFHEPIVLAVLAAPPSKAGIEQNYDACTTTFGNTTSGGHEEELSLTFKSSVSVGFKVMGGALTQSEIEAKGTISREVALIAGRQYDVSKTVSFTTGANEDTVVFTTTPMDQFTYRFLHHPLEEMIGREIVVTLPREPITLQVERGYYNAHVAPSGLRIDESVFAHRIGDPTSYPSADDKDDRLARNGGLEIGPQSVGQGSGSTEIEVEVSSAIAVGGSLELGFEIEAEVTAGTVLVGGSLGASVGATFQVTSGASTTYTGSVGSIGAPDFAAHRYSFGLYTYVHRDAGTGQEFEVIDYWVE